MKKETNLIIESEIPNALMTALRLRAAIRKVHGTLNDSSMVGSHALVKLLSHQGFDGQVVTGAGRWFLRPCRGTKHRGVAEYPFEEDDFPLYSWVLLKNTELIDLTCDGIADDKDFPRGQFVPPKPIWIRNLPEGYFYEEHFWLPEMSPTLQNEIDKRAKDVLSALPSIGGFQR
jgi:hypothetical protein